MSDLTPNWRQIKIAAEHACHSAQHAQAVHHRHDGQCHAEGAAAYLLAGRVAGAEGLRAGQPRVNPQRCIETKLSGFDTDSTADLIDSKQKRFYGGILLNQRNWRRAGFPTGRVAAAWYRDDEIKRFEAAAYREHLSL